MLHSYVLWCAGGQADRPDAVGAADGDPVAASASKLTTADAPTLVDVPTLGGTSTPTQVDLQPSVRVCSARACMHMRSTLIAINC